MVIHMNRHFLDFDLENEKNLMDVLLGLEEWAAENGEIIQKVLVDDIYIPLEAEAQELQRDVSSIGKIDVFTATKEQHAIETVYTLTEYVKIILNEYLKGEGIEAYDDIMESLRLVYDGIVEILKVFNINDLFVIDNKKKSLRLVLNEIRALSENYEKKYFDKEGKDALKAVMKELLPLLPKLVKWGMIKNLSKLPLIQEEKKTEYFKEIVDDFYTILKKEAPIFEKIAENLQIGKDAEALDDVCRITEILDEYIVLFRIAKEGFKIELEGLRIKDKTIEDLFADILGRLKDVSEALKHGDMISVGDILEYETRPLFEILVELLGQVKEFTFFC
jgi:hypothetical protein